MFDHKSCPNHWLITSYVVIGIILIGHAKNKEAKEGIKKKKSRAISGYNLREERFLRLSSGNLLRQQKQHQEA